MSTGHIIASGDKVITLMHTTALHPSTLDGTVSEINIPVVCQPKEILTVQDNSSIPAPPEISNPTPGFTDDDDPSNLHVCPRCKTSFATSKYLKAHMRRQCVRDSNVTHTYECDFCTLSFKHRFQLTRHHMQHNGARPFKCESCEKTFLSKSHLKRHAVVHLPADEQQYKCERCDKVFAWPSLLENHMKSHTGEKRFKCGICGRMYLHLNSLKLHMTNKHTLNGMFTCVVCKECFSEATDLIFHMKSHNAQESVMCERCNAFFSSLSDLETHVCTNFGGKPLFCKHCEMEFDSSDSYSNHLCMELSANRLCGCCGRLFKSLWHLREHLITHTGEKPYKCEYCQNMFRRKRELDIHVSRHNAEKVIPCPSCSMVFTSNAYLKQHARKEHREKKFRCDVCKHSFMHKCARDNHMQFHARTGNKRFGKKYHRDDGLLVKELVAERLQKEGITGAKDNQFNACITQESESLNFPQLNDSSNEDNDGFSQSVIEPRTEVRNAELDPTNITTIYQTDVNGQITMRCASCLMDFENHAALLRHRKNFHNDGKPYKCDCCLRSFTVAANLSQHRAVHNLNQHKYGCRHCGKRYKVTHKMREHLMSKHKEDTTHLTDLELHVENSANTSVYNMVTSTTDTNNILSNIVFINSTGETVETVKRDGTSFLLNLSSLISELGNGLGENGQKVNLQDDPNAS